MSAQPPLRDSEIFMFDPAAETMPRDELSALQLARLKSTLERAYAKVPHYSASSTRPASSRATCKSLADIVALSLHPEDRPARQLSVRHVRRAARPGAAPARLLRHDRQADRGRLHQGDLDLWSDLMARSLACVGARPGDIVHNAYGYGLFTGGLGAHYGAERLGCTVVPMSGGGTERQVTLLQDFGAHVLCATPSYALNIAEVAENMGVDLRKLPLRVGVFGAEPWSDAMRHDLEARLGIKASTSTACRKSSGRASPANATSMQNGLHGWEDHFLFEVIDPQDAAAEADGRSRRTGHHHADQGSAADDPLPHARHHAARRRALRLRAHAMCASCASPAATTT